MLITTVGSPANFLFHSYLLYVVLFGGQVEARCRKPEKKLMVQEGDELDFAPPLKQKRARGIRDGGSEHVVRAGGSSQCQQ